MHDKDSHYLVITTVDTVPTQYKAHRSPRKFGDMECFKAFKVNTELLGSSPKWIFLEKSVFIPVRRIKYMIQLRYHINNDSKQDHNTY